MMNKQDATTITETTNLEKCQDELDRTKRKLKKYKKKQKKLRKLEKSDSIWRDDEKSLKKERKKLKKKIREYSENQLTLERKISELQLKIQHCREDKAMLEQSIPLQRQLQKQQDYIQHMEWFNTIILKEMMPGFIKKYGTTPTPQQYIDAPYIELPDTGEEDE